MKAFILFSISFYQLVISGLLKQMLGVRSFCRFTPSCSEYTKQSVQQYGILQGLKKGIIRLLHCQPFSKAYGTI